MRVRKPVSVLVILVIILGFSVGAVLGAADLDRLIANGLIYASVGAISYSAETLQDAKTRVTNSEDAAEVEAALGLVYMAYAQEAKEKGKNSERFLVEAKGHYEEAIRLDIDNAFLYGQIGQIHSLLGETEKAKSAYTEALKYEPESVVGLYGLGQIAVAAGDNGQAEENLKKAVEYSPDHLGASMALAEAIANQGRLEDAVAELTRVERYHPRVAALHYQLGVYYKEMGNKEKAAHELDRTLQLDPEFAGAKSLLNSLK